MASQKSVEMPPEAKIVIFKDFDLKKIEETFQSAPFVRRISKMKTRIVANAIRQNKFVDNFISVYPTKEGSTKYDIMEGQHRMGGLVYARDNFGLLAYDLVLHVYEEGNPREIYRRLNLGTPLSLEAHLKGIDNGELKFFNGLRKHCDHYAKGSKIKFVVAINWLHYAKSTSIRPVRPLTVDDFLLSITEIDIATLDKFIPIIHQIETNPDSDFYNYTIMRNFFRIYFENKISEKDTISLGNLIKESTEIQNLAEKRDNHAMRGIYHFIIDRLGSDLNLKLEKGIVKSK